MSPGPWGLLVVVPALLFIKDHEQQDQFSHVHGHVAVLMKCSPSADEKGTDQARVDVFFLEDSGSKWHILFVSVFSALPVVTDHKAESLLRGSDSEEYQRVVL